MRATIFNIYAILSLFSVAIHVVPTFVRYAYWNLPHHPHPYRNIQSTGMALVQCVISDLPQPYAYRNVKQCALFSSSFLRPSRKQLFSGITLNSDQICHGIH